MKTPDLLDLRRKLLLGGVAAATLPLLQGCFPVVAGGAVGAAAMFADRRTTGAFVEDEAIEWKTRSRLRERFGNSINVGVTSYNRIVLLTGQAPDAATQRAIEEVAAEVENIRGVVNEVTVAGLSSLTARSNDALVTSQVKARFVDGSGFRPHHVKVVTSDGTVFLMGLVTRREADASTEIARTTSGVQKVVRVFEYIDENEAARLDRRGSEPG